jgi:hypothetical protein
MLLAAAHSESHGRDALPVCLILENPHRLVSWWDIVNRFDMPRLLIEIEVLTRMQERCGALVTLGMGGELFEDEQYQKLIASLDAAQKLSGQAGLWDASHKIKLVRWHVEDRTKVTPALVESEVRHVRECIQSESYRQKFLYVARDRAEYVDNPSLFGEKVLAQFPSAAFDIRESGNCLAAECATAAVFHLMRAVEWGLRAIGTDLGIRQLRSRSKKTTVKTIWGDFGRPFAFFSLTSAQQRLSAQLRRHSPRGQRGVSSPPVRRGVAFVP